VTDSTGYPISKIRQQFPMIQQKMHGKPYIYLDSAATAQKPLSVIERMNRFYLEEYGTVHRAVYDFASQATDLYQAVRNQVKKFLNAAFVEEIVFTRGTTDGINLVAQSFSKAFIASGDEILISVMEHHSNIVPWQMACEATGAQLKCIPINERGELIFEEFKRLVTHRTKLVAIGHISNVTGTLNPIEEIVHYAHAHGAKVLVDGAQSAAHLPVDVQQLGVDFFVFSGHKAYGPTGIGILYGRKGLLEKMPPCQGGGDMIEKVSFEGSTYQHPPLRFEAGTPPIAEVIGFGEAIHYIESIGRDKIAAWEQDLLNYATNKMKEVRGLTIFGTSPHKGAMISFQIHHLHPLDIGTLLDLRGIAIRTGHLCAQPTLRHFGVDQVARVSFGLYNTLEEIDLLVNALKEVSILLQPTLSY
jgi:cysteine desulfurase/selenocysteine lyase